MFYTTYKWCSRLNKEAYRTLCNISAGRPSKSIRAAIKDALKVTGS